MKGRLEQQLDERQAMRDFLEDIAEPGLPAGPVGRRVELFCCDLAHGQVQRVTKAQVGAAQISEQKRCPNASRD